MADLEKVIKGLEEAETILAQAVDRGGEMAVMGAFKCLNRVTDAIAMLKAQVPVKPILARGWYWCGAIRCRNSLTSALENDVPARKPNYCERCGRAVKWDEG